MVSAGERQGLLERWNRSSGQLGPLGRKQQLSGTPKSLIRSKAEKQQTSKQNPG